MRRVAAAVAAGLLVCAGCGDAGVRAAGDGEPQLVATCGDVRFPGLPADASSFPPLGAETSELDLAATGGEAGVMDVEEWLVAERSEDRLVLFGRPSSAPEDPPFVDATFRREGDRWVPQGWGQCRIEVSSPGWGHARFVLDPDAEPTATSTGVAVLATERACASGRTPGDREVRSVVAYEDDTEVHVVVLVEPSEGDQECPGHPSFPFRVELGSALAGRTVFDASRQPPFERPWPPTASSLASQGDTA
jgi:hypothetical protein